MSDYFNDWIQEQTGTAPVRPDLRAKVRSRVEREGLFATAQALGTSQHNVSAITSGQRVPMVVLEGLPARLAELDALDRQGR